MTQYLIVEKPGPLGKAAEELRAHGGDKKQMLEIALDWLAEELDFEIFFQKDAEWWQVTAAFLEYCAEIYESRALIGIPTYRWPTWITETNWFSQNFKKTKSEKEDARADHVHECRDRED